MAFIHTKKVYIESFIKARIRIRSQTSGSGSATLVGTPEPHLETTSAPQNDASLTQQDGFKFKAF
jgi:hypothetical protein